MDLWLVALAILVALFLLLALKLRGPRNRTDLSRPPRPKRPRFTKDDVRRLGALLARGDESGVLRLIRQAGYDEAEARKLVDLAARLEAPTGPADPPPDPGWTEAVGRDDGLSYGRAFGYNEALHRQDERSKKGDPGGKR
jgi:hypothetical protein